MTRRKNFIVSVILVVFSIICFLSGVGSICVQYILKAKETVNEDYVPSKALGRVLYISSYDPGYVISSLQAAGIKDRFAKNHVLFETFYMDTGEYPSEDEGLSVLWECSFSSYENWNGPYISKPLPKDPWGNDYVYTVPGENGLAWKIMSLGKDGKEGGAGYDSDITSS